IGSGGARQRRSQRGWKSGAGDPGGRIFSAAIQKTWAVRSGAGEHSRQSVAANGDADGAASRTIGTARSIWAAAVASQRRDRRLPRPWAGVIATCSDRRLEQPVAALRSLNFAARHSTVVPAKRLRAPGPIRRTLTFWHAAICLPLSLRPVVMGPCFRTRACTHL